MLAAGYGISDPGSLRRATRIAASAAVGYAFVTFLAITAVDSGLDMRMPAVFSMICGYLFGGVALLAAGRRKLISTSLGRIPPVEYVIGAAMSCLGSILFMFGATSFVWIAAVILIS